MDELVLHMHERSGHGLLLLLLFVVCCLLFVVVVVILGKECMRF